MLEALEKARLGQTIPLFKREESPSDAPVEKARPTPFANRFSRLVIALVALLLAVLVALIVYPQQTERLLVNKLERTILERDLSTYFDWRPVIEVREFKNSTVEKWRNSHAESASESLRSYLRKSPNLRVADAAPSAMSRPTWIVNGTLLKKGDKVRISVELLDADNTPLLAPIELDRTSDINDIMLDDLQRLARFKERERKAIAGTKNDEARAKLLAYYKIVVVDYLGIGEDEWVVGKELLDHALELDPNYVPALVAHAHLVAIGKTGVYFSTSVNQGIKELDQARTIDPKDSDVLVMRCRLLRAAIDAVGRPKDRTIDAAIDDAAKACKEAVVAAPQSALAHLAIGRILGRTCSHSSAMGSFEQAWKLDRSLSAVALAELTEAALNHGGAWRADSPSHDLVEFVESRRFGSIAAHGAHLLRGAVLLKLAERRKEYYAKARTEFEVALAQADESWSEAAAITGLVRVASHDNAPVAPTLIKRLSDIEREALGALRIEPFRGIRLSEKYRYIAPDSAMRWLDRVGEPSHFKDFQTRIFLQLEAGHLELAKAMLKKLVTREKWELSCHDWLLDRAVGEQLKRNAESVWNIRQNFMR